MSNCCSDVIGTDTVEVSLALLEVISFTYRNTFFPKEIKNISIEILLPETRPLIPWTIYRPSWNCKSKLDTDMSICQNNICQNKHMPEQQMHCSWWVSGQFMVSTNPGKSWNFFWNFGKVLEKSSTTVSVLFDSSPFGTC